jgi:cold shock protein
MAERETGTVKWFDNAKGWGFITRASGDDVFVHYTSVRGEGYKTLEDGQQVEFEVAQGAKGLQAQDVIVVH